MEPILEAESVRVDVGGLPAVDRLSFVSAGNRILVLGAARALFEAAAGLRPLVSGALRVGGRGALGAVRAGLSASASLDPPMPVGWTVAEYVTWSARLAGHGAREARNRADEALARADLEPLRRSRLGTASRPVRRLTVVAGALATGAEALLLEDPLHALPADQSHAFAARLVGAVSGRRTAVFAARAPLESPLTTDADEAIVLDGSRVAAQGRPAEIAGREGTFMVRVAGDVGGFVAAVRAGGAGVQAPAGPLPELLQLGVQLGPLSTLDLFRLADESNATVLELRPLGYAFT